MKYTYLRCQALEQGKGPFVLNKLLDDSHSADLLLEVSVLDSCLDCVQWCSDSDGCDSAGDGRNEVLSPCGFVVVFEVEEEILRQR